MAMTAKKDPDLTASESLSLSWKKRLEYTDGLHGTKFHNSWRAVVFTIKGKKVGCHPDWKLFRNFKRDMFAGYIDGYLLCRRNKSLPFSLDNCFWISKSDHANENALRFEYNGESRTFREWCLKYDLSYAGVRKRYYTGKDYTPHEILFGKKRKPKKIITDFRELDYQKTRNKASKMISAYKCKDKKKGFSGFDLTVEWFIENIFKENCSYCGADKNIGADRLDNTKSHKKDNIVPCCYRCNTVRQDHFSFDEMKKIGLFIKENIDYK